MDVEAVSVGHVVGILGECPRLRPNIATNDKILLTDGHIDIYRVTGSRKSEDFVDRATVQVKGRVIGPGSRPSRSYQLQRSTLTGYLKLGGLLFLVVDIEEVRREKSIQYAVLSPLELDNMLKSSPEQSYFSIKLKPLPDEHAGIEAIVKYMAQAHNENPEARASEPVWERARDISIIASHRLDANRPIRLNPTEHDFTVKITTQDGAQAFSRGEEILVMPESYIGRPFGKPVRSGDVTFDEPKVRNVSEDTVALELSETLSLHRSKPVDGREQGLIKWGMNDSFDKRLKDLGFVLSALDNRGYFVGDTFFGWDLPSITDEEDLRRHYRHLQRTAELFEYMGARTDLIDLSKLEEKRHRQLWDLYDALVEKKEMIPDKPTVPGRILQPIGDWGLELFAREGPEEGKFRIYHLLDPEFQHVFYHHSESGEGPAAVPVTAYEVFKADGDFARILNLGLDRIVEIYSAISEYDHASDAATRTLLELINSADRAPARQEEFLGAAQNLNEWLVRQYGEAPHKVVNAHQIQFRRRELSADERSQLRSLRRQVLQDEVDLAEALAFSCSVLLGDMEEAGDYFEVLPTEVLQVIQEWPIWALWKPEGE